MRVLITGATGFIGSHVAEFLHKKGYEIIVIVRESSNRKWIEHLPIKYFSGNLLDKNLIKDAVDGVDYVYNIAGVTKARTKQEYFLSNYEATKVLLEATLEQNPNIKRFVHVSSQTVTGPSTNGKPVNEDTPCRPITTYGLSKYEAEKECKKLMGDIPITIVRPSAVYGPRDKDIYEFFRTIKKGIHPLIGFSDTYVSLVHVYDLVRGIILAGESEKSKGQIYFIAGERYYNWKEFGQLTSMIMGKKVLRVRIPGILVYGVSIIAEIGSFITRKPALLNIEKAKDLVQRAWICSIEKAMRDLDYREELKIEDGIRNTIEWYKENRWL